MIQVAAHSKHKKRILDLAKANRLPHSILISGMKGIGKSMFAKELAMFLLSNGEEALRGGHPLSKKLEQSAHPDFKLIESPDGKDISIDEVRKISRFLSLKPTESPFRVLIIDSADYLNQNSANALLKILEEPPASGIIILLSHKPALLLDTIKSRCFRMNLPPLGVDDFRRIMQSRLPDITPDRLELLMLITSGSPGLALELEAGNGTEMYSKLLDVISQTPGKAVYRDILQLAAKLGDTKGGLSINAIALILEGVMCSLAQTAAKATLPTLSNILAAQEYCNQLLRDADTLNLDIRQTLMVIIHRLAGANMQKAA